MFLSTILYLINVEDQLNYKNLPIKLCMRLSRFHPQYSLELSVLYIPVHILASYKCNLVVRYLFGIRLLLKRNKMTNAFIFSPRLFLVFSKNSN